MAERSWEEATLLACAQAAISAVYEGDEACDHLCEGRAEPAAKHARAALLAARRASAQADQLKLKLPGHSRRARMAARAAAEARQAAEDARDGIDVSDLDRALGRAQRAALAIFELVRESPPEKPIPYQ